MLFRRIVLVSPGRIRYIQTRLRDRIPEGKQPYLMGEYKGPDLVLIHFLWWAECPSHPEAWHRLQQVLADLKIEADVKQIEIRTDQEAERWRFPGSPTILVNGEDIDPPAQPVFRLTCRLYFREDGRPSPLPSEEMIRRALAAALQREQDRFEEEDRC